MQGTTSTEGQMLHQWPKAEANAQTSAGERDLCQVTTTVKSQQAEKRVKVAEMRRDAACLAYDKQSCLELQTMPDNEPWRKSGQQKPERCQCHITIGSDFPSSTGRIQCCQQGRTFDQIVASKAERSHRLSWTHSFWDVSLAVRYE